jgi:hypothetical protein
MPTTHNTNWYCKTNEGWFKRFYINFNPQEKLTLLQEDNNPDKTQLLDYFKHNSSEKIPNPPDHIQAIINQHLRQDDELIIANINEQGNGTIYCKRKDNYMRLIV